MKSYTLFSVLAVAVSAVNASECEGELE